MPRISLSVSVADEHMDRFSEVVGDIEDAGMRVEQKLEEIGVLTGSIDSEKVESLRRVEGVSHVERSRRFRIAPPDSDLQ